VELTRNAAGQLPHSVSSRDGRGAPAVTIGGMSIDLGAAREFLFTHARVLERRLFAHRFAEGEPSEREAAAAVERAVDAYRNADGGYGQALEPDCRTPHSQPEAMRWALQVLTDVGPLSARSTRARSPSPPSRRPSPRTGARSC